jgi:hypothetical protein
LNDEKTLTVLYTANLAGDLDSLPRLFTLIQHERQTAAPLTFLLDLGDTCSLDSWLCRETLGRAPFLVMDGMGYDAVLIGADEDAPIPTESLRRLLAHLIMPVILWNRTRQLAKGGVSLSVISGDQKLMPDEAGLIVDRSRPTLPDVGSSPPVLGDVPGGAVARVDVTWPACQVKSAHLNTPSPGMRPDPTIAALVEFVKTEAQHFAPQRPKHNKGDHHESG